jgi:hypothetical protein
VLQSQRQVVHGQRELFGSPSRLRNNSVLGVLQRVSRYIGEKLLRRQRYQLFSQRVGRLKACLLKIVRCHFVWYLFQKKKQKKINVLVR